MNNYILTQFSWHMFHSQWRNIMCFMNNSQSLVCRLGLAVISAQSCIAYWWGSTELKECGLTHWDLSEMQASNQPVNSLLHDRFIKESKMWISNESFCQHSLHIFCEILWDWFQWARVNILFRQWLGTTRVPFYQHGLTLIPVWASNYMSNEVWVKLLIHSKTSTVLLLKVCNG